MSQSSPIPGNSSPPFNNDPSPAEPGFLTGLFSSSRTNLLGDVYNLRPLLDGYGISLGLQETSEVLGNVTGGVQRDAAYEGLTLMSLGVDLGKAIGLEGGIFNVSAFQIHGRNLSAENLYTLQTASGIEALRATRLWELWYQQSFAGGKADIKIGQQSLDQEFYGSAYSGLFINTMMGWPLIPSVNLYAGGPAYPLSSLGVRLRVQPIDNTTVLAGVYDDNPPGGSFFDDSQVRGASQSGTKFNLRTGALIFGEVQYAINAPMLGKSGLPGIYKLGFYYDTAKFYDQRLDTTGLSLADPNTSGDPLVRRGNFSVYGVFDQAVWRPDPDAAKTVGVKAPFTGRETDSVDTWASASPKSARAPPRTTATASPSMASRRSAAARFSSRRSIDIRSPRGGPCSRISSTSLRRPAASATRSNPASASATRPPLACASPSYSNRKPRSQATDRARVHHHAER